MTPSDVKGQGRQHPLQFPPLRRKDKGSRHEHGSLKSKERLNGWLVRLSCAVHEGFAMVIAKGRDHHVRNSARLAACLRRVVVG